MNLTNLSKNDIGAALRAAFQKGLIRPEDTAMIFYDLNCLKSRLDYLCACFPPDTLHGLAIKANPLAKILSFTHEISPSIGVEAASVGEVTLALNAGFPPDRIVFDSPVKTVADLEFALKTGVHLNIDNLDELERVNKLVVSLSASSQHNQYPSTIGLRINPQVGVGTILESSVAGNYSKFGVPIKYRKRELEQAFLTHPWLTGVHLHVGSQGCSMELLSDGIGVLYDFISELNPKRLNLGFQPVSIFDIGGGLPISYNSDTIPPSMKDYVSLIRQRAPSFFNPPQLTNLPPYQLTNLPTRHLTNSFRLITEFGRWVFTNPGWTVSRVEYVKHDPDVNTAMLHVGADLFLRECLNPQDWQHEYTVFDCNGRQKEGLDILPWNLAGPLCFSGDIIAKGVKLPKVEEGDWLVIHDTGGYTFSMWSRFNSRQIPGIIGYRNNEFEILKERETLE
ncbi:MAG: hypothetical protein WCP32_16050, partial [Bacteroidota bacterium]